MNSKLLSIVLLISILTNTYQAYIIRTSYSKKLDYTTFKCPQSSTHIQQVHINTVTNEVICTYYPPARKSTTK